VATTANVRMVTKSGSTPAVLTVDDESDDGLLVLVVKGVRRIPDDLPAGAYLEVDDPELADIAALAGYFVEAPTAWKRRVPRYAATFIGLVGILCFFGSLFRAVEAGLALDLLGALTWASLGIFMGFVGIAYLGSGEQSLLGDIASRSLSNRHVREDLMSALGRGQRRGASGRSESERHDDPPES